MSARLKECPKCRRRLGVSQFYAKRVSRDGLQSWCKECMAAKKREWLAADPDRRARAAASTRAWKERKRAENPEAYRREAVERKREYRAKRRSSA